MQGTPVLEAIIKASPLAIIAVDAEGRVILWNKSAEQMLGWTESDVLGKPLPILPPEAEKAPPRIDESRSLPRGVETVRISKDGMRVPVSIWTAAIASNGGSLTVLSELTTATCGPSVRERST